MFTLATDCVDMRPHKYLGIWSLRFVFLFSFFSACEHGQEVRISICTTSELNVEYGNNVLGIIFFFSYPVVAAAAVVFSPLVPSRTVVCAIQC